MLSRKYYNDIASILKQCPTRADIVEHLADYFEKDNPRFDRDKFLEASKFDSNNQ